MNQILANIRFGLPLLAMAAIPALLLALIGIPIVIICNRRTGKFAGLWPFT